MKTVLLFSLLTSIVLCDVIYQSCVIESTQQCSPLFIDRKSCELVGGVRSNQTCKEMEFVMGTCCNLGNCGESTSLLCALAEGVWKKGGDCAVDCVAESSCCFDADCIEGLSVGECEGEGGVFIENRPCESSECLFQDHLKGICCSNKQGHDRCYDSPKDFCGGTWYANGTCESNGCAERWDPENPPLVNISEGRCCGSECFDTHDEEYCIKSDTFFYEYGLGCTDYPCYSKGICVKENFCLALTPPNICLGTGGTYMELGECLAGGTAACTFRDGCNMLSEDSCYTIGGTWNNGSSCPRDRGACCKTLEPGVCNRENTLDVNCYLQSNVFFKDKQCDEVDCIGRCCVHQFCSFETLNEQICLSNQFQGDFEYETCPSTGACSDEVTFQNAIESVNIQIDVNNINISTGNSQLNFTVSAIRSSSVKCLNNSKVNFESLALSDSDLVVDFDVEMVIETDLVISSSNLIVELSSDDKEILGESGEPKQLIFVGSLEGNFTTTVKVNGETDTNVEVIYEDNYFSIKYTPQLGSTEANLSETIKNDTVLIIVILSLAAAAIIAVIAFTIIGGYASICFKTNI